MTVSAAGPAPSRRQDILGAAARLFAERGFPGVGVDEIGAAVGITGPGLYRHFKGKQAMLSELLVGISERLWEEGRRRVRQAADPADALASLVSWHVEFALDSPDLITLHGRELPHLPDEERKLVRRLQRQYVELWVAVVRDALDAAHETPVAKASVRATVHAVFGLLNSTPYSTAPTWQDRQDLRGGGGAEQGAHPAAEAQHVPGRGEMERLLRGLAHGAFHALASMETEEDVAAGATAEPDADSGSGSGPDLGSDSGSGSGESAAY